jgi:hypothetical protein
MPAEVTITLLQGHLETICDDPLWLEDAGLCTEFEGLLDEAEADYDDSNYFAAAFVLEHLLERVEEEEAEFHANGYWLMRLNVEQAYENVLVEAEDEALIFHFHAVGDTLLAGDTRFMSGSPPTSGSVDGSVPPSAADTLVWVRELETGWTIPTGVWSVQLDLIELELSGGDLSLHDVQVHRYNSAGVLQASMYLHQGQVMSLPSGSIRIPIAETLTSWGAHSAHDRLAVSFRLENSHTTQSGSYSIRTESEQSPWGGSWLAHPYGS